MAVAYKGVRSASHWVTDQTINALKNARSSHLFALFRHRLGFFRLADVCRHVFSPDV